MKSINQKKFEKTNLFKKKLYKLRKKKNLTNRKKYYNSRLYLIKKNRALKKIENELFKTKLELQTKQKNRKLFILNMFLGFVLILLIYLKFYRLALVGFGYLLIQNNSLIEKTFYDYLIQKGRFNEYYKKKFPVFYYVLPVIGIFSGLGMFYTSYLLNNIYQDVLYEKIHLSSCQSEMESLQLLLTVFIIILVFYVIIDVGIAIYVIKKANHPVREAWRKVMIVGRLAGGATVIGSAGTLAAGAPEPSPLSNIIHTKTPFGRGWDTEPGDVYTKKDVMKLQQFAGNDLLLKKLNEINTTDRPGIVSRDLYIKLLNDPDVKDKVMNSPDITDIELYQLGYADLTEVAGKNLSGYVKSKMDGVVAKVLSGMEGAVAEVSTTLSNCRRAVNEYTPTCLGGNHDISPRSRPNPSEEQPPYTSDEDFATAQNDVAESTPGKKAKKDQDILDARRRGLPKY